MVEHDRCGCGGYLNDRAAAARLHGGDHGLHEEKRPLELQGGDFVEVLFRGFFKPFDKAPAGGVDGDVDAAERRRRGRGERVEIRPFGDIAKGVDAADLLGEAFQLVLVSARNDRMRAFKGETASDDLPHIAGARGPENNRCFVFQSRHDVSSIGCLKQR